MNMLAQVLIDTQYQVHGEGQWHGALILLAVIAAGAVLLYWLHRERTKGWAGRLLPVTAVLLVLLIGYLAWQPTLVRIDRWQHPAQIVVVTDESSSMRAPMASDELTANLDLLAFWQPDAVSTRPMAVHQLLASLRELAPQLQQQLQALQAVQAQIEQGVPLGQPSHDALAEYAKWLADVQKQLGVQVEAADRAIEQQQQQQGGEGQTPDTAAAEALAALATHLSQLTAGDGKAAPSADVIANRIKGLTTLQRLTTTAQPLLRDRQTQLDAAWFAANEQTLAPWLDNATSRTRLDAANVLVGEVPGRPAESRDDGPSPYIDPRQTDLYAAIEEQLKWDGGEVVSHVVLVTDGGHNGGADPGILDKLKRGGVQVTVVGIGQPSAVPDYAIADWHAPRLAEEGEQAVIQVQVKLPRDSNAAAGQSAITIAETNAAAPDAPVDPATAGDAAATGNDTGLALTLTNAAGEEVATIKFQPQGEGLQIVRLPFDAPKEGHHVLTVRLAVDDANLQNNQAVFALDTVRRKPRLIVVGDQPNWDTAYLYLAMRRGGYDARQMFPGTSTEAPNRGGSSSSIPATAAQWSRHQAVFLHGQPFDGFTAEDAATLRAYVAEEGGSLVVFADPRKPTESGWQGVLATVFDWPTSSPAASDPQLRLASDAYHLPVTRLSTDGPSSARIYAQLGPCEAAMQTPAQHQTLLTNVAGQPVMTLGFYGAGRVYFVGFAGLDRISAFDNADHVDRLLGQLVGEASSPFMAEDVTIVSYPTLPVVGSENWLITTAESGSAKAAGVAEELALQPGSANRMTKWLPAQVGPVAVNVGEAARELHAVDNPGLEQVYYEFNEPFLEELAQQAGGKYVPMTEAQPLLAGIEAGTWESATADRTPLANHWLLLLLLSAVGAAHWTFRKLAGLAI